MNQKEIKELIEFLVEKDIAEFELQRGDMKLLIKRGAAAQPAPVVQVTPAVVPVHRCPLRARPRLPFVPSFANHRDRRIRQRGGPGAARGGRSRIYLS